MAAGAESSSGAAAAAARRPRAATARPAKRAKTAGGCKKRQALAPEEGASAAQTAAACKVPKFLRSLYAILQTEDPRVIAWVDNQELAPQRVTAFHILAMARFEREVLPKYFKHQKFASFQRQLNNFGFRKWTKTQSSGVCTFSHNCFPPDLAAAPDSREAIRDLWRRKSSQVVPPATAAATRRRVAATGVAKARAKREKRPVPRQQDEQEDAGGQTTREPVQQQQQQQASPPPSGLSVVAPRRRPAHVQVQARDFRESPAFADTYRSPNANGSADNSAYRHSQSHQPSTKTLARPAGRPPVAMAPPEPANGLEAFCEDSFKQFVLPPLQPHHLLAATPRGLTPTGPFASHRGDVDAPPAFGGFRHSLHSVMNHSTADNSTGVGYKTYEYPDKPHAYSAPGAHQGGASSNGAADAAALQGTFLEPWIWDAQASSSGLELGAFPMELDWQEAPANYYYAGASGFQPPHSTVTSAAGSSSGAGSSSSAMAAKEAQCHQPDRGEPSNTEEFGLENLLFVE